MSSPLIALIGLAYVWISCAQFLNGDARMGLVFGGYAIGQVGLWLLAK